MNPFVTEILNGASPAWPDCLEALGRSAPLLHQLADTPQDSEWHAEGDVGIHTARVLAETYTLVDANNSTWTAEQRLSLVLAAVFHDIGKALVTRERMRDGRLRIVSPRHAAHGRAYLALRLGELGLPPAVHKHVLALVGHHHDPRYLVEDNAGQKEIWRLASLVSPQLVHTLELADLRGRDCIDSQQQLDTLELFKLLCEEHGAWPELRAYDHWEQQLVEAFGETALFELLLGRARRDHWRGRCNSSEEAVARLYPFVHEARPVFELMVGPSGSGKSSWTASHRPDALVISLDAIREELAGKRSSQKHNGQVMQAALERLKLALRKHPRVVMDATNLRRDGRQRLLCIAEDYHALTRLVVFTTPIKELNARNRKRAHPVPGDVLDQQIDDLEWPTHDEADAWLAV